MAPREYIDFNLSVISVENTEEEDFITRSERIQSIQEALNDTDLYCDEEILISAEESSDIESSSEISFEFSVPYNEEYDYYPRIRFEYWNFNSEVFCINCAEELGITSMDEARHTTETRTFENITNFTHFVTYNLPHCSHCQGSRITYNYIIT